MPTIRTTAAYQNWIDGLRDRRAAVRVSARVDRLSLGNPGDVKPVGEGGGTEVVILLCGGDKGSQDRDIREAKALAKEI